jgi:hypothetical protein
MDGIGFRPLRNLANPFINPNRVENQSKSRSQSFSGSFGKSGDIPFGDPEKV